jgi:hypothetical protein
MKTTLLTVCIILASLSMSGQKYLTKTGYIKFYSDAPVEKIQAINRQVAAALNTATGDFQFKVLMKSFVFEKALMQEHFNENYVESDKYPNATFIGKVTNLKDINFAKDAVYTATVEGKLTIHNVTKDVRETGTFELKNNMIAGKAKFNVLVSDYDIKIPSIVVRNISNTIEVTVDLMMDKFTQ